MVARRGRVMTATSEEMLVLKLPHYLQHCRLHIIFIVFCVYIRVYYALYIFFLVWCMEVTLCVNKSCYNFLGSVSAMCGVKPWRLLFPKIIFFFSSVLYTIVFC